MSKHLENVLDYPIELHYSQTKLSYTVYYDRLDYPIELHYSQTMYDGVVNSIEA